MRRRTPTRATRRDVDRVGGRACSDHRHEHLAPPRFRRIEPEAGGRPGPGMVPRHSSRLGYDRRGSLGWLSRIFVAVASGPRAWRNRDRERASAAILGGRVRESCYSKSRNAVTAWISSTKPSHVMAGMPTRATTEPTASAASAACLIALLHINHGQQSINRRFRLWRTRNRRTPPADASGVGFPMSGQSGAAWLMSGEPGR